VRIADTVTWKNAWIAFVNRLSCILVDAVTAQPRIVCITCALQLLHRSVVATKQSTVPLPARTM